MKQAPVVARGIELSSAPVAASVESHGCLTVLRRVNGPDARELYIHCLPGPAATDAGLQAQSIYRAILGVLEAEGGSFGSVVSEMVFLRDLPANIDAFRAINILKSFIFNGASERALR